MPSRVIGRRTEECIRAGVMFGGADAIDGIVRRIKDELAAAADADGDRDGRLRRDDGARCARSFDRVEPYLTLQGLQIAHALLRGPEAQL